MANEKLDAVRWWSKNEEKVNGDAAGVRLETVWLNHVGIVAQMSVNRRGNGSPISDEGERAIAALLRLVSDAARQLRRSGPLLGIVVPKVQDPAGFEEHVERLARNQEWHRGDFIIRYAENDGKAKQLAVKVLFPFDRVQGVRIAMDAGEDAYFAALRERLGTEGASDEAKRLMRAVIEGPEAATNAIKAFRNEVFDAISEAAAKGIDSDSEEAEG